MDLTASGITPLGRADTRVKVLGELVDPEAIEREIVALSEGKLSPGSFAVAAIPDERAGNRLVAVFDATVDEAAAATALAIHQSRAPGFLRLAGPVWLESLPRTELGKLRRGKLATLIGGR